MILKNTVLAAHQEMGLPTDDETVTQAWDEIQEAVADRIQHLRQVMINEWKQAYPESRGEMPYLENVQLGERARLQAEEEIRQEWIDEPVQAAISLREQAAVESA